MIDKLFIISIAPRPTANYVQQRREAGTLPRYHTIVCAQRGLQHISASLFGTHELVVLPNFYELADYHFLIAYTALRAGHKLPRDARAEQLATFLSIGESVERQQKVEQLYGT